MLEGVAYGLIIDVPLGNHLFRHKGDVKHFLYRRRAELPLDNGSGS